MSEAKKIWFCKIGEVDTSFVPDGGDLPMRMAVAEKYLELTDFVPDFCFSGWAATLDEPERAVVENREPSAEYQALWYKQQAAPAMFEALTAIVQAEEAAFKEWHEVGGPEWREGHPAFDRYTAARSALSQAQPEPSDEVEG
jgi:hypothetical protein